jgi:hypothetical protein
MLGKIFVGVVATALLASGSYIYWNNLDKPSGCSSGTCAISAVKTPSCCQSSARENTDDCQHLDQSVEILEVMPREVL